MKARLLGSLAFGAIITAALVAFEDKYRRAALMASAARSGGHQTVTSILVDGFVGVTLIAGLVVFVLGTVAAARGRARARRAAPQSWSTAAPRRRSRTGTGW
jgi:hypothetical protein